MCRTWMIAGMSMALAGAALAGPLNKRWVAPDAAWVVHIDVEAVRGSTLWSFVNEHKAGAGIDLSGLEEFKAQTGLDPFRDIKGVTVYGAAPGPEECVAVVETTAAVDGALEKLLEKERSLTKGNEGGYTIYTWTEGEQTKYGCVRPGAGPDDRIVLAAPAKERLLAAIRQIESPAEGKSTALATMPRTGSMLYVSGTGLGKLRDPECSMILQKMEAVRVDVGEAGGDVYAELAVTTPTSEDATNMQQTAQGALALAQMCAAGEESMKPLMNAGKWVSFKSEEKVVTAKVKCTAAQFRELLGMAMDEKARRDSGEHRPRKRTPANPKEKGAEEEPAPAKKKFEPA